jgi:hypothetical protein
MVTCINCGVELDESFKRCPLCGKDPRSVVAQDDMSQENISASVQYPVQENRKYLWELSGIITFSGIVICTIVDLLTVKGLSWSLISDTALIAIWAILTLFHLVHKRLSILSSGIIITILAALFLINLFTPGISWFFPLAFPITLSLSVATAIIIILYKAAHFKGLNIIAAGFLVLSGFCIIIEILLDKFHTGRTELRWSLITGVSALPFALVLFFYHYRLKKGKQLDSFFHI